MSQDKLNPLAALPNPLTPLALIPPELAFQVSFGAYTIVGALAVVLWDVLDNLTLDYLLVTHFPVRFPTVAYFVSRLAILCYFLITAAFLTSPTGHCAALNRAGGWFFVATISSVAFLFFLRVRAVYNRNRYITVFFAFLWLLVVASCITVPFGIDAMELGPTKYCIQTEPKWYLIAPAIAPFVNDTIVYVAITWRLLQTSHDDSGRFMDRLKMAFSGKRLPALSKALLRDGQSYYLMTVIIRCIVLILFHIKSIPAGYRAVIGVPCVALIHISACRVFRHTRFGIFHETFPSYSSSGTRDHTGSLPSSAAAAGHGRWYRQDKLPMKLTFPIAFASNSFSTSNSGSRLPGSTIVSTHDQAMQVSPISRRSHVAELDKLGRDKDVKEENELDVLDGRGSGLRSGLKGPDDSIA